MPRTLLSLVTLVALLAVHPQAQATREKSPVGPVAKPGVLVNLNTATVADLQDLPGVGPKVAGRIIEYRQKRGPFKKIEELMNVQGIGEKSFLKLRSQVTVGARTEAAPAEQK